MRFVILNVGQLRPRGAAVVRVRALCRTLRCVLSCIEIYTQSTAWEVPRVNKIKARARCRNLKMVSPPKSAYQEHSLNTVRSLRCLKNKQDMQARLGPEKGHHARPEASGSGAPQNPTPSENPSQSYNNRNCITNTCWQACSERAQSWVIC